MGLITNILLAAGLLKTFLNPATVSRHLDQGRFLLMTIARPIAAFITAFAVGITENFILN